MDRVYAYTRGARRRNPGPTHGAKALVTAAGAPERERRPARGAPAAFRSGGAAVRAWGEKAGSRPPTPCSETSVVPASYVYIGLLAYLWESA